MAASPLVTAGVCIVGAILCFWHVETREQLGFLLSAVVYGYILEQAAIASYGTYEYNAEAFPFMLLDVPVSVAFTWAGILYAGWQTARYLGFSRNRLPFFVGLFALHIDLAMDVVAIRIPYWTWGLDGLWFGVPLNNFFAWFAIAFIWMGLYLWLEDRVEQLWLRLVVTLTGSSVILLVAITVYGLVAVSSTAAEILLLLTVIEVALLFVLSDDLDPRPVPLVLTVIPFIAHAFFLVVGFWIGFYGSQPLALAVALAMLGNGVLLHAVPLWHNRRQSSPVGT